MNIQCEHYDHGLHFVRADACVDYIVQSSRFQVYEEFGCILTWEPSGLAIIMLTGIPIVLFSVSTFYLAMLEIRARTTPADRTLSFCGLIRLET